MGLFVFLLLNYDTSKHSRYKPFVGYMTYKIFLPLCGLFVHSLDGVPLKSMIVLNLDELQLVFAP